MKKKGLLDLLVDMYPHLSRKELFTEIMCGKVKIKGETMKDPKHKVPFDSQPEIGLKKYVSRGGYKLEKVLSLWDIKIKGNGFLDAGCSTGGFTDCLLQSGASFVHAVDVGYNQLDYSLRINEQVYVHEKTNIMQLDLLDPIPYGAVADLSFRSITEAAAKLLALVSGKVLIALVKPQFEIKNPDDNFDGIIRESEQIYSVTHEVLKKLWDEGSFVQKTALSPIKGRKGNQELLFLITDVETRSFNDLTNELRGTLNLPKKY
ncbi:MAG: TlyA family rRNA (cytidine-2'-O)-methyltransferase [Spirochaetaceae bacterium]|jgi:23S rRNA (cytidine1920-2'-O)/16S rRNA (cytidine1409-2'-O)-methyltransferase|nr:TlyA family rRNA (cytidine-2'-O)-methyltransferase [Spirochaetaceae bacterium]